MRYCAMSKFFVFDTNALLSASLLIHSVNAKALDKAFRNGLLAFSEDTFMELLDVLYRPKFDKYLTEERRSQLITRIERNAKRFTPKNSITICRDPKDNMFLELAVSSQADCIITGDNDLLILHPFRGIPIITASEFLASSSPSKRSEGV